MANEQIITLEQTPVAASTNPQNNIAQMQGNNAITIPVQIQPVVTQPTTSTVRKFRTVPKHATVSTK